MKTVAENAARQPLRRIAILTEMETLVRYGQLKISTWTPVRIGLVRRI
jgi:hypothetical protein